MKGALILTEGRSGSNWLGTSAASTGLLGVSKEWVDPSILGVKPKRLSADQYINKIVESAATDNGFFTIKLFPRHLHWFHMQYGVDIIKQLRERHDLVVILLTREDTIRQAISFSKGIQTGQWTSRKQGNATPKYDFEQICRAYFTIRRSYDFWKSYVDIQSIDHLSFTYEQLLPDGKQFMEAMARHASVEDLPDYITDLKIQRNSKTEEWYEKFLCDIAEKDFVDCTTPSRPHPTSFSNFIKFLRSRQMKPVPYSY